MRFLAIILATISVPVAAFPQVDNIIQRCATQGLGLPHCPAAELQAALDRLAPGDFRQFRELGMETFAMLTAMRHVAAAVEYREGDEDNCRQSEEIYQAGELWFEWVQLPKGVTEDVTADFQVYAGIIDEVAAGLQGGDCL